MVSVRPIYLLQNCLYREQCRHSRRPHPPVWCGWQEIGLCTALQKSHNAIMWPPAVFKCQQLSARLLSHHWQLSPCKEKPATFTEFWADFDYDPDKYILTSSMQSPGWLVVAVNASGLHNNSMYIYRPVGETVISQDLTSADLDLQICIRSLPCCEISHINVLLDKVVC